MLDTWMPSNNLNHFNSTQLNSTVATNNIIYLFSRIIFFLNIHRVLVIEFFIQNHLDLL